MISEATFKRSLDEHKIAKSYQNFKQLKQILIPSIILIVSDYQINNVSKLDYELWPKKTWQVISYPCIRLIIGC